LARPELIRSRPFDISARRDLIAGVPLEILM
jgi:hypothetical protein